MIMRYEGGKTWPYPTRSVDLVGEWRKEDFDVPVIELNALDREALKMLDDGLFEELKRIKKKKVEKTEKVDGEAEKRRELVKETYWNSKGLVEGFPELERTIREPLEESFVEKVNDFRSFKLKIKELLGLVGEDDGVLSRSSRIVLDMYRKYTNVMLAKLLLSGDDYLKNSERLDKFINGVFYEIDEEEKFVVLGTPLLTYVEEIEKNNEEKWNYPNVWFDEDDIELVANVLLKMVDAKDWKVVKRSTDKKTLGVYKPKKEVRVGRDMERRMEEILPVIAHEIEAHVMHSDNDNQGTYTPKIMKNYSAGGRDNVLSEMFGRWVEDETRIRMGLEPKKPETLYFRTLEKKKKGSTFIECFDFFMRNHVTRQGQNFEEVMADKVKYDLAFDYVYDRTMRLFRKNTPLNDKNNYW